MRRLTLAVISAFALTLLADAKDAAAHSGPSAGATVQKRCHTVRVKRKRHGRVVKRNGKPVFRRVRRCKKVPSPGCRFVKVKKRRNGKVVKRNGRPVYIKVERCPPKQPDPGPGPGPGPEPSPGTASELANRLLALPQHQPGNIDLFTSKFSDGVDGIYPTGSAMAPQDRPVPTETQARTELTTFLERRFGAASTAVSEALALYDSAETKALVAEPLLRAAFAGMKGTLLEPTVDHLLTGARFTTIRLGGVPGHVIAVSTPDGATGKNLVIFSRVYDGERLEYLIPVIGHELLHDDQSSTGPAVTGSEEAINGALTAMTYMQLLSQFPELAHRDTELARYMNDFALTFINSREADSPNSEIYAPTGRGTAPGSALSFVDFWTERNTRGTLGGVPQGGSSPGPMPLRTVLQSILTPGTPIADPLNFDQATAASFANLNDDWLSDVQRAQLSVLLQLVSVGEIAQATGLAQQQIIDTLGLQPYLDAIP